MNYSRLNYRVDKRICTIAMHHAESKNAADDTMVRELTLAFVTASKDAEVKVVVLTGTGSLFCTGEGLDYYKKIASHDFGQNVEDARMFMRMAQVIYALRKPVIARVNGHAHGAGCVLATVCDFAIASEKATFGFPEVHNGLIPALAIPFLVKKMGEGKAREMLLRGGTITAAQAKLWGLATACVAPDALDSETSQLAAALCTRVSGASIGLMKEMFATLDGMKLTESVDYASNMHAAARMTEDGRKGIDALIKQEKSTW